MNIFFDHKEIHKYTRVVKSRNEKSSIDYIIISRSHRNNIQDVKVRREPEINSDHYMVVSRTKIGCQNLNDDKVSRRITVQILVKEKIKTYK